MKKTLITMLAVLLSMTAFAKVKVTSGSAACLKEKVSAVVVFDYSNATFDKDQSYQKWCGEDYADRVAKSTEEFTKAFNKKSKGMQISDNASGAKYKIVVKVGNCDQYMGMSCNWGQMQFKVSAVITIIDLETNETVCTVTVDEENGGCDYSPTDRITDSFASIGKELAKQK